MMKKSSPIAEGQQATEQIRRRRDRDMQTLRPVILLDVVLIVIAVAVALLIAPYVMKWERADARVLWADNWVVILVVFPAFITYILWLCRGYDWHVRFDANRILPILARCAGYMALFGGVAGIGFRSDKLAVIGVLSGPLVALFVYAGRKLSASRARAIRINDPSRLAIVGASRDIERILKGNFHRRFPLHRVEILLVTDGKENLDDHHFAGIGIVDLGATEDIAEAVSQYRCESVLVATVTDFDDKELRRLVWSVRDLSVRLYLEPMLGGISGTRVSVENLGTRSELQLEGPRFRGANGIQKRFIDIVVSSLVLIGMSPIFVLVAIAIKLEDGGPVFYKSERIGRYGNPFKMWKFRSMYVDADSKVEELAKENNIDLFLFKMKDDPRVTRVGRFIRKTSIDEFPQFINSLNGTMSIVGPRPPLRREVERYSSDMRMRLEVKPGITGLWQVNGRSDLSAEEAENLDLYYADNWSVGLDIATFFRTFIAVLASRGAY